ncbi:hypothetical protein F3Y22_tig00110890pilonHSYRG01426 [Hibiscus syriacus]|uniref:Uncharacterized protein n=1 Tax=Hibiscus syriacus TaxID=106335 RepID=A0A6A2ZJW5_HIBSY|nr:hypothetical protein F3Y22_tig00110890pilonHSYRG01426 [Hibiscus syriacus]
MVRFGGVVICLLIVAMDVKHLSLWIFKCRDPSRDAFKLALGAAALLTLAHILANLLGGCMCVCSQQDFHRSSANTQLSVTCLIFTCDGIVNAGDRDTIEREVQGIVWSDAPPFPVHRRDIVFCSRPVSVAYYVSATAAIEVK